MSLKPNSELTRDELADLVLALEFVIGRALELRHELLERWDDIPDQDRKRAISRAFAPLLIDPRPADDETIAYLERLEGLWDSAA